MPTYGYRCRKCKHEFEVIHKINDKPPPACEKCGGSIHRVFHPVGIIFKGSGFYTTDYKQKPTDTAPRETKSDKKSDTSDKSEKSEKPSGESKSPEKTKEKSTT